MAEANDNYKDRLFVFLFGREDHKDWTLSLYNAVSGSNYTDPEQIRFNTIEKVLYVSMHNDISFLLSGEISLFEHQSTYNPNMPLRMIQYLSQLFTKYLAEKKLNKYSSALIPLPVPKLVVFYNGIADKEDEVTLHLEDSFPAGADPDVRVKVRMININAGHSPALMAACKPLQEYAWIVAKIREYRNTAGLELKDAIGQAIDELPPDFIIKNLITTHRAEVNEMLETEYNEAEFVESIQRSSEKIGEERGLKIGEERGLKIGEERLAALLRKLTPGSEDYLNALNGTSEEREKLYLKYGITD